jgi:hypothetical protein
VVSQVTGKVVGILVLLLAILYGLQSLYDKGDASGYARSQQEHTEAQRALDKAANDRQLVEQERINAINDEKNRALLGQQAKTTQLNQTITVLRDKMSSCAATNYAHYVVFNESARSEYLQESSSVQRPAEEADGLDAIRYSTEEHNACAIQLNSCIDTLVGLECVH